MQAFCIASTLLNVFVAFGSFLLIYNSQQHILASEWKHKKIGEKGKHYH